MGAKYQLYKDVVGKFRFRLKAENNKIVAVSEAYEQYAGCLNGIKSVQANCGSEIEDNTIEVKTIPNPKYQVFYDKTCGYRFRLNAKNGEIIAQSEGYKTKEGCMNGIEAVKTSCGSEIEDMTTTQTQTSDKPVMETAVPASEMTPETKGIKLELQDLPSSVKKGTVIFFKGKITEDGKGVGNARVTIREHDRSFLFDEVLAAEYTKEDGSFEIGFTARKTDMWDDTAEIYAQYDRKTDPKHVRTEIRSITIT